MITINKTQFILENIFFKRQLEFNEAGLQTTQIINKISKNDYTRETSGNEFMLKIGSENLHGYHKEEVHILDGKMTKKTFSFNLQDVKKTQNDSWEILEILLETTDKRLKITCCYGIHKDFPSLRKWLKLTASEDLKVSNIYLECLNAYPGKLRNLNFFRSDNSEQPYDYFSANSYTDSVQLYNPENKDGYYLSSNLPGFLRRFLIYPHWGETALSVGYNSECPNSIYLKKDQTFTTYESYLHFYQGEFNSPEVRNSYRSFVRNRLPTLPNREGLMYCTWIPFLKNINEELLFKLIDKAASLGFLYFVIDDGWFTEPNWAVDKEKFPNGLEPITKRIHEKGMKVGLWFNVGTDYGNTKAHQENNRTDIDGNHYPLGFSGDKAIQCMATNHRTIITKKLKELTEQYHIDYFKLDFSSIVSPYGILTPGCHNTKHEYHKNYEDSLVAEYSSLYFLREELKKAYPNLIIDYSFETFGTATPSIAALQYSELHHISNMNTNNLEKTNALNIRNTLYDFSSTLPIERILGSLICIQDSNLKINFENLLTSLIGAPLLAGNILELPEEEIKQIDNISKMVNILFHEGSLTEFIKLHGNSYVNNDDFDGFVRYNKAGFGLICVFSNESKIQSTTIKITNLPTGSYTLKNTKGEEIVATANEFKNGLKVDWINYSELFIFQ